MFFSIRQNESETEIFSNESCNYSAEFRQESPIILSEKYSNASMCSFSKESEAENRIINSDLDDFINQTDKTLNFQNKLQSLIAQRNLDNATIYKKAFIDKKFFSKIISKKNYVPKKQTVIALGLALELSIYDFESFIFWIKVVQ